MGSEDEIVAARVAKLIRQVIRPAVHAARAPLEVAATSLEGEPLPPEEVYRRRFEAFAVGSPWGGAWSTTWFRFSGRVPEEWAGSRVVALVDLGYRGLEGFGGEGLVWDGDRPVQGVNSSHGELVVASPARGGEPVLFHVEAAANPAPPWGTLEWPLLLPDYGGSPMYRLLRAELAAVRTDVEAAYHDLRILSELASALGTDDYRRAELLHGLNRVCSAVDLDDVAGSLLSAQHLWKEMLSRPAPSSSHRVSAVGHAHLDTAWLWPLREARRKAARSFSTAVRLMEEFPEYRFACSQAQQHAWMRDLYPSIFEAMREKVDCGQFEPVGSMWVEPDTNLPCGESLVRQLVYGKRFFLEEYGVETEDAWLPDAFGYSGALPQILRQAGVSYFLTQKLSWNELNRFPHSSFWWEGIDGSRVLAHFPPTDTYEGDFSPGQLRLGVRAFAEHGRSRRSLYLFGLGDGGGGPTRKMLLSAQRMGDLDGLPRVELEPAGEFFHRLEAESAELPVWSGELYLERHRGVYTSQAAAKRWNRRLEELLRQAELWSVAAGGLVDYPAGEIEGAWRLLLLHQFHDILPGSSIHWVHEDSRRDYETVGGIGEEAVERAVGAIAARVETSGAEHPVVVFNPCSQRRCEVVEVDLASSGLAGPAAAVRDSDDRVTPAQDLGDGRIAFLAEAPGCGWASYDLIGEAGLADQDARRARGAPMPARASADGTLTNGILSVRLDENGLVSSVLDEEQGREVLAEGAAGNLLQILRDLPNDTDAWDVDLPDSEEATDVTAVDSLEVGEEGPVRASLVVSRRFGSSRVSQQVRLAAGSRRLEFVTDVDWHERHKLLKVAFPVAVHSPRATFEIQFGHIERPTHANTSWDVARFEVPAQRWAYLGESGYGVALLNDSKYGYDVRDGVMRLSLLRAPGWPDPLADRGHHRFTYALLPHPGGLAESEVTEEAEALNQGLRAVPAAPASGRLPARASAVQLDKRGVMVSAVKLADEGEGVVVRLWEAYGGRGPVTMRLAAPAAAACRTDLLERDLEPLQVVDGAVRLALRPFELVTVKVSLAVQRMPAP